MPRKIEEDVLEEISRSKQFREKYNLVAKWVKICFQYHLILQQHQRYRWRGHLLTDNDLDDFIEYFMNLGYNVEESSQPDYLTITIHY